MRFPELLSRSSLGLLVVAMVAACVGEMPPPPELRVTSPVRGLVQGGTRVTVEGSVAPGVSGAQVTRVEVNDVTADLAADGTFTATVDVPEGATLLRTVALANDGGAAKDVRSVHAGELRPVGTRIERAVTASLSKDAFAKLAAAAGPLVMQMDLMGMLAPMQPMANLGDGNANVRVSVKQLGIGGVTFTLVPVEGGLQFATEITGLDVGADAAYGGTFVVDGTTAVRATADKVTIGGTLVVTPAGEAGFSVRIASPTVNTTNLRLDASGIVGSILGLLNDNLSSTIQRITTSAAEQAMEPLINQAFGALAGEQAFAVLGHDLAVEATPAAVAFSAAGAQVTINLVTRIAGGEASRGYIYTPNGTPAIDPADGVQIGISDDLINEMLAQVHAIGLFDVHVDEDVGVFDAIDIHLEVPPMVRADGPDGTVRLVLGDMIASVSDDGNEILRAALNAQVDVQVKRGGAPDEIALEFGRVGLFVNLIDRSGEDGGDAGFTDAAAAGIELKLKSMQQFLVTIPTPSVGGLSFDSLALRGDEGYLVVSGEVR